MFLAWYLALEPPVLTGLDEKSTPPDELPLTFSEVHDHFASLIESDAEMLYVVGLMAHLCPWCLGEYELWEARSERYRSAYRRLAPNGISPSTFERRGFYGEYFKRQSSIPHGY
ncbi:MAG TPA: hypothetical protein VII38_17515 [Polyangia bacterium]|jgi:hypothetical protein